MEFPRTSELGISIKISAKKGFYNGLAKKFTFSVADVAVIFTFFQITLLEVIFSRTREKD